jgi:flagellar biosynthesis anti-sigma factor FlgM
MTSTIPPLGTTPPPGPEAPPRPASATAPKPAATEHDSVTLSAAAQTTTQLLSAARSAPGTNQPAIENIRSALQAGSYNVAPDDLAHAIATVLRETAA